MARTASAVRVRRATLDCKVVGDPHGESQRRLLTTGECRPRAPHELESIAPVTDHRSPITVRSRRTLARPRWCALPGGVGTGPVRVCVETRSIARSIDYGEQPTSWVLWHIRRAPTLGSWQFAFANMADRQVCPSASAGHSRTRSFQASRPAHAALTHGKQKLNGRVLCEVSWTGAERTA